MCGPDIEPLSEAWIEKVKFNSKWFGLLFVGIGLLCALGCVLELILERDVTSWALMLGVLMTLSLLLSAQLGMRNLSIQEKEKIWEKLNEN
jgi:Na+-transporting NADH:ubiquinone oxidoreductase subunit NqrE